MAHTLTDDGTFDTVIRCDECGHETRFNYDGEQSGHDTYNEFVADCIVQLDDEGCEECHTEDD